MTTVIVMIIVIVMVEQCFLGLQSRCFCFLMFVITKVM